MVRALGAQSREIWQVIKGVAFRGARAEQDNGKATCQLFCSTAVKALYFVTATVQQQSHSKFVWTSSMRVLCVYAMCVRALIRAHMAYANIAAAMFKVNNVVRQQEFLLTTITVIPIRYI